MVRKKKARPVLDAQGRTLSDNSFDWTCTSEDVKPESAEINDIMLELDTGKGFYFDGDVSDWLPIGGKKDGTV